MTRHLRVVLVLSIMLAATACGASSSTGSTTAESGPRISRWEEETFGPLRLGMTEGEIISVIGAPSERSQYQEMAATGERVALWSWPSLGLETSLVESEGVGRVASISAQAPCTFVTGGSVAIGTSRADVIAAYSTLPVGPDDAPREAADRPDRYVLGSAYAALVFTFVDGHVSAIFLGATGAE